LFCTNLFAGRFGGDPAEGEATLEFVEKTAEIVAIDLPRQ